MILCFFFKEMFSLFRYQGFFVSVSLGKMKAKNKLKLAKLLHGRKKTGQCVAAGWCKNNKNQVTIFEFVLFFFWKKPKRPHFVKRSSESSSVFPILTKTILTYLSTNQVKLTSSGGKLQNCCCVHF